MAEEEAEEEKRKAAEAEERRKAEEEKRKAAEAEEAAAEERRKAEEERRKAEAKAARRDKWKARGARGLELAGRGGKRVGGGMAGIAASTVGAGLALGWANIFIFLSILLYISDLSTRFDGINIDLFLKNFTSIFSWQWLANGVVLTILISYILITKPNPREAISFVVLVELFSLIFFLGGFTYGIFHIIFAILLYIFLLRSTASDIAAANYTLAILLFFDFFGYGILGKYVPGILSNRLIIPIWFYYTLLLTNETQKSFFTKAVIIFVVLLNVAVFAYGMNEAYNVGKPLTSEDYREAVDYGKTGLKGMKQMWSGLWTATTNVFEKRLEYATGGYYESEVEENEHEPLGVYLENIEPAESYYYEDEPVMVWATLKARTLDVEEPISIKIGCSAKGIRDDEVQVIPQENFTISTAEEEDISCRFNKLTDKSSTVNLSAEFNFKTMAYLKTYFMHHETLRALRRQNIDVFDEYGITDKEPVSKCTNGPINLGIGTKEPPIGIYKEGEGVNTMPRLGITITNLWDGEIKKIKSLIIQIPDSLVIEPGYCDQEFVEYTEEQEEGFNIYKLEEPRNTELKDTTKPITFNCGLRITDPNKLLGDTPVSVKYFRATAEYDYIAKEQINLDIRELKSAGSDYMGAESEPRPKQDCLLIKEEEACKTTKKLCIADYENGIFTQCLECTEDRRECSKIKDKEYCNKDPCYHYCEWIEAGDTGICKEKDIRKQLQWPIDSKTIIKCYENRKELETYYGIAISAEAGNQVKAAEKGIVHINNDEWREKRAIEIEHYPGFKTRYKNLNKELKVEKWDTVNQGDIIGTVGDNTIKDEVYLHFNTLVNGLKKNPLMKDVRYEIGYYSVEGDGDIKFKKDSNCCAETDPKNEMYTFCNVRGIGEQEV